MFHTTRISITGINLSKKKRNIFYTKSWNWNFSKKYLKWIRVFIQNIYFSIGNCLQWWCCVCNPAIFCVKHWSKSNNWSQIRKRRSRLLQYIQRFLKYRERTSWPTKRNLKEKKMRKNVTLFFIKFRFSSSVMYKCQNWGLTIHLHHQECQFCITNKCI